MERYFSNFLVTVLICSTMLMALPSKIDNASPSQEAAVCSDLITEALQDMLFTESGNNSKKDAQIETIITTDADAKKVTLRTSYSDQEQETKCLLTFEAKTPNNPEITSYQVETTNKVTNKKQTDVRTYPPGNRPTLHLFIDQKGKKELIIAPSNDHHVPDKQHTTSAPSAQAQSNSQEFYLGPLLRQGPHPGYTFPEIPSLPAPSTLPKQPNQPPDQVTAQSQPKSGGKPINAPFILPKLENVSGYDEHGRILDLDQRALRANQIFDFEYRLANHGFTIESLKDYPAFIHGDSVNIHGEEIPIPRCLQYKYRRHTVSPIATLTFIGLNFVPIPGLSLAVGFALREGHELEDAKQIAKDIGKALKYCGKKIKAGIKAVGRAIKRGVEKVIEGIKSVFSKPDEPPPEAPQPPLPSSLVSPIQPIRYPESATSVPSLVRSFAYKYPETIPHQNRQPPDPPQDPNDPSDDEQEKPKTLEFRYTFHNEPFLRSLGVSYFLEKPLFKPVTPAYKRQLVRAQALIATADNPHRMIINKITIPAEIEEKYPLLKDINGMQGNIAEAWLCHEVRHTIVKLGKLTQCCPDNPYVTQQAELIYYLSELAIAQENPDLAFQLSDASYYLLRATEILAQGLEKAIDVTGKGIIKGTQLYLEYLKEFITSPTNTIIRDLTAPLDLASKAFSTAWTIAFGSHTERAEMIGTLKTVKDHFWDHPEDAVAFITQAFLPSPTPYVVGAIKKSPHTQKIVNAIKEQEDVKKALEKVTTLSKEAQEALEPAKKIVNEAIIKLEKVSEALRTKVYKLFGKEVPEVKDWKHIWEWEIGTKRKKLKPGENPHYLGGFHSEYYQQAHFAPGTYKEPNQHGVYEGFYLVEGLEPKFSTFFPKSWGPDKIKHALMEAYHNPIKIVGDTVTGITSEGIKIVIVFRRNEKGVLKITTFYPLYKD